MGVNSQVRIVDGQENSVRAGDSAFLGGVGVR